MDTFRGYLVRITLAHVAGRGYRILMPDAPDRLLDEPHTLERFERSEYLPYWATLWPDARMLAEHVAARQATVGEPPLPKNGRPPARVLELGCGLGLTGIVAASLGLEVTLTDYDEDALAFAAQNAALNGISNAEFRILDWTSPPTGQFFDHILAADALYEARNHAPVARCVATLLAPGGVAWLSDPGRSVADAFPRVAADAGLRCETLPHPRGGDSAAIAGRIFTVTHGA